MPGKKPCFQVVPASCDVAQPMSAPPPPYTRPVWNAATMVLPKEAVSGSTSVLCWLGALWNGSWLTLTRVGAAMAGATVAMNTAHAAKRPIDDLCTLKSLLFQELDSSEVRSRCEGSLRIENAGDLRQGPGGSNGLML